MRSAGRAARRLARGLLAPIAPVALASLVAVAVAASCSRPPAPGEVQDHPPSPQAQVMPAPLANESARVDSDAGPDAGPPAVPLRADELLPSDVAPAKESPAHVIELLFRTADPPPLAKGPEVNGAALEAARKRTESRARVEVSQSRLRLVPESPGFVFPRELEVRARADRLGHVALLGAKYRALAPGTLRALFAERRLDVSPLDHAEILPKGEGPRRLGARTRRVELVVRSAKVTIDVAHVADVGEGGVMLCRLLLDLASAQPRTPLCTTDEVPLFAEYRWSTRGTFVVEATSFSRRPDVVSSALLTPPAQASRQSDLLSHERAGALLSAQDLRALRHGDLAATSALEVQNPSTALSVAWLDGVPAAWLAPSAQLTLEGLAPGRYQLVWRSVLGDVVSPPETVSSPGRAALGGLPDAGKEAGK